MPSSGSFKYGAVSFRVFLSYNNYYLPMSKSKKQKSEIEKLVALGPARLASMLLNEAGRY